MFQSKEHLIRTSDPSLWGFAGLDLNDDHNYKVTTRVWKALNTKTFNALIVVLVLIHTFAILSQILIDSNWIQDPSYKSWPNCTNQTSISETINDLKERDPQMSATLLRAKHVLSYIWLTIILFFFIEVLLRIYCGKSEVFVHPFDLLDVLIVILVFVLSLVFYFNSSGVNEFTLLLLALRLWRIFKIMNLFIDESQQKILQTLNVCEKEKTHCEHKIDILILKVEDLEHEVAYLKEKLKKSEKDNSIYIQQIIDSKPKKSNAKRTQSSQSYCPCRKDSFKAIPKPQLNSIFKSHNICSQLNYTSVDIESQPLVSKSPIDEMNDKVLDLDVFAKNLAQSITSDVIHGVIHKHNYHSMNGMQTQSNNTTRSPSTSSRHSSCNQYINNSFINSSIFNDSDIYSGLNYISHSVNHSPQIQSKTSSNLVSSLAAKKLNDETHIEDMNVDLNVNVVDIPLSSL